MTTQSQADALSAEIKRLAEDMADAACATEAGAHVDRQRQPLHAAIDRLRDLAASAPQGEAVDEQAAWERWAARECPSGDVESVQRQWEASSDYAELYDLRPVTAPPAPFKPCPGIEGYVSGGGLDHVMEKARAMGPERAGVVQEGWNLFAAKGLPELMAALERADRKGYLPDALSDEWAAFQSVPFAAPPAPAAEPLTNERIFAIAADLMIPGSASHVIDFARAIERAHGIIPKESA